MNKEKQAELALRTQKGDKHAFGLLYEEFVRPIYKFIYFKTHHKQTAEDILSATFIKALDNINSFKAELGPFSAWLYQIARNTIIDQYRSKKPEMNIDDAWDLSDGSDLMRDIDARDKIKKVEKYLKEFTSEQRDIVIMRVWQGLSYEEISAVLGKSEASCKMMYSRTMKKLRETMPLLMFLEFIINL